MAEIGGTYEPRFRAVRDAFERNFDEGRELGASVAVYQRGRAVVDLWGGTANAGDTPAEWRQDTIALLASATKGLVASAAMLLVDRGLLDLDAPVADYWPEFAAEGKAEIPLRWVLGHRSGVVAVDQPLTFADIEQGTPVTEALAAAKPAWIPGRAHGYHCLTMGWLIGEIIRRVTGLPVGRFFAKEITSPLGLDLHIGLPDGKDRQVADLVPPTEEQLLKGRGNSELGGLNRAICDPASLFHRSTFGTIALTGNPLTGVRVLQAEIPSCGGAGNAAALAHLYAALIGEVNGIRLLRPETTDRARTVEADGMDLILRCHTSYGRGFMLPGGPMWPGTCSSTAFGHAGVTGAFAYADPDNNLAFAYVPNRMSELIDGGNDRVRRLIESTHRCAGT
ncbi:serine hydrolase domain-containing protein [Nonomuraea basaltis]|uniref:serine hydrolase domain-containing protein n=1 Tax=Nonomuraea basaltis TaxID=2495887 RepID=UPI00110C5228|nr:serine hydrolase domain-containing protein [Nonomuraea basaltis]TMR91054.1 beta-lactamase family protein [Nonomuraea basaltis]